jgi:2-oxoglutarate ferredoxin oxidoreductase subunit delta
LEADIKLWREPLGKEKTRKLKAEIYIISNYCKGCGYCIEFCPEKVLERSEELNKRGVHYPRVKKGAECVFCGFCSAICPDFAIFVMEKKTEDDVDDRVE